MKKLMVIVSAVLLSSLMSYAQDSQTDYSKNQATPATDHPMMKDGVKMKDGKVWLMKDGNKTEVLTEVNLGTTKVDSKGNVTFKDGTKTILKEGDHVRMDGTVGRASDKTKTPKENMNK